MDDWFAFTCGQPVEPWKVPFMHQVRRTLGQPADPIARLRRLLIGEDEDG